MPETLSRRAHTTYQTLTIHFILIHSFKLIFLWLISLWLIYPCSISPCTHRILTSIIISHSLLPHLDSTISLLIVIPPPYLPLHSYCHYQAAFMSRCLSPLFPLILLIKLPTFFLFPITSLITSCYVPPVLVNSPHLLILTLPHHILQVFKATPV